jgi:hypothetical protein
MPKNVRSCFLFVMEEEVPAEESTEPPSFAAHIRPDKLSGPDFLRKLSSLRATFEDVAFDLQLRAADVSARLSLGHPSAREDLATLAERAEVLLRAVAQVRVAQPLVGQCWRI